MGAPRKCSHELRRNGRCVQCLQSYQRRYYRTQHATPNKSRRKWARHIRSSIAAGANWYVRKLLSQGTRIPPSAWTQEQITLKLALLNLRRSLRALPSAICLLP